MKQHKKRLTLQSIKGACPERSRVRQSADRGRVEGFTLLELLVVAGIFSGIALVIAQVFFSTIRTNAKTETFQSVKQNGDQTLEIMSRFIQNAQSVTAASCPESGATPVLSSSITLSNFDGGQTTFLCVAPGGYPRIASESASGVRTFLTNEDTAVYDPVTQTRSCTTNALAFTCTSIGGIPSSIHITYILVPRTSSKSAMYSWASSVFETTVFLRNK